MNILAAIRREERQIERQLSKLQRRLDGVRSAARALGSSANHIFGRKKRVLSAAGRARIVAALKKRWAKARANKKRA